MNAWYRIDNVTDVFSPALLVYPERIEQNLRHMLEIAGGPARLRPHIKTHKLPEIVALQLRHGITRVKCATIAEAEMAAAAGATDVLLAYQPVGPNIRRLLALAAAYPRTRFAAVADDAATIRVIGAAASAAGRTLELLADLDCGMHRTGVASPAEAVALYRLLETTPGIRAGGLHAYDGHICDHDPAARRRATDAAITTVRAVRDALQQSGARLPRIVAGGTPTFPFWAAEPGVECSPGTCVLWDAGYAAALPDLPFVPAAAVLTRVVSKPGGNRVCLDLGYKAIAAEGPHPRVQFPDIPDAAAVGHNEEHLVIETARAAELAVGDAVYGIPRHICPTVALHAEAVVVRAGAAAERWRVVARDRMLSC